MASKKDLKLSATRINTFLQCKLKYKFNYIDHLPKQANPALKLGRACHKTLEYAGNVWLKKSKKVKDNQEDIKFTKKEKEDILQKYNEYAVEESIDDFSSSLSGYDLIKKKLNNFTTGEILLELEKKFGTADSEDVFTKDKVPLVGAIDKIARYNDDTLIVADYKTQATAPTSEDIRYDMQLSLYDLVASKLYSNYKRTILCLDLLKFEPVYSYRTLEDREYFENYLKAIYDNMAAFKPKKDAKPNINTFCPWCDYKDSCPAYEKLCKKSEYKFFSVAEMSEENLFDEWERIKVIERIIDSRKREVKDVIINKIRDNNSVITKKDQELYIKQNSRVSFDTKAVYDIVPIEDFIELVSLNKTAVDKYLSKANSSIKKAVYDNKIVNFNAPFLSTRNIKKRNKKK